MERARGSMRLPPPIRVKFNLKRPKSTPPLSPSPNFERTEAIRRTPQTKVYTCSKSLDTNSYLDACQDEELESSPVKVNGHELKDFEFRNDTLRKITESSKRLKMCLYPAINMLCGTILPMEHTCERKVKKALKNPCRLPVPGARCLAGIGKQPHYCAKYAPTDPKHPWNEGSILLQQSTWKRLTMSYHYGHTSYELSKLELYL